MRPEEWIDDRWLLAKPMGTSVDMIEQQDVHLNAPARRLERMWTHTGRDAQTV